MFCLSITIDKNDGDVQVISRMDIFFRKFQMSEWLNKAGFNRAKGMVPSMLLMFLVNLVFFNKPLNRLLEDENCPIPLKSDAIYRFLANPKLNWRLLLLGFASNIIQFLNSLTKDERVSALVIDDSSYYRDRSEKVELLAKCWDHAKGRYYKGFRNLTIGWTDGFSFIPLVFSLLTSGNPKKRLYEQGPDTPDKSPGKLRREESVKKATDVTLEMIDQILEHVKAFEYVLFDSWFAWPQLIKGVLERERHVVCMLKDMPNLFYQHGSRSYRLSDLYALAKKKHSASGNVHYTASMIVDYYGVPVRVVFVKNRSDKCKREWLALLSTDLTISEEEIIRIYGLRWDIEVCFKACKSLLRMGKEIQGRSYDSMVAHTSIVYLRLMLLTVSARESRDDKTLGGLFYACCDDVQDMTFRTAFSLLMDLLSVVLRETLSLSKETIEQLMQELLDRLPKVYQRRLELTGS